MKIYDYSYVFCAPLKSLIVIKLMRAMTDTN